MGYPENSEHQTIVPSKKEVKQPETSSAHEPNGRIERHSPPVSAMAMYGSLLAGTLSAVPAVEKGAWTRVMQ
jgi:hypothetical protein